MQSELIRIKDEERSKEAKMKHEEERLTQTGTEYHHNNDCAAHQLREELDKLSAELRLAKELESRLKHDLEAKVKENSSLNTQFIKVQMELKV